VKSAADHDTMPTADGVEIEDGSSDEVDLMDLIEGEDDLEAERARVDPQVQRLHDAIEEGRVAEARQLLGEQDARAWVVTHGVDGDTALHLACLHGRDELVPMILGMGAEVNAADMNGSTPLHDAAAGGYLGICQRLLAAKAIVTVQDEEEDTALHNAARGNHAPVVQLLLAAGADRTLQNGDGDTPGSLAREDNVVALFG
jgi:hypothetical protein